MQTSQHLNKARLFCIQQEHALALSSVLLATQTDTLMDPKKQVPFIHSHRQWGRVTL